MDFTRIQLDIIAEACRFMARMLPTLPVDIDPAEIEDMAERYAEIIEMIEPHLPRE